MGGDAAAVRRPVLSGPIDQVRGLFFGHAFPPDIAIVGERDIGEDAVGLDRLHGARVRVVRSAGRDAEVAGLGIDRMQFAVLVWPEPCDVVADDGRFPAFFLIWLWRDEHREVRLAAGRGKGSGEIGFMAIGLLHADDEHVFGHPLVFARDVGGDAQCEAFFSEQGVAAVARAVGHDLASLGEMDDVFVLIARP